MPVGDRALAWHQRIYWSLLVLYPPGFRREWGPALVQLFGDQLRHPRRPGRAVGLRVWLRTLDDLLGSVPRQQWEAFMEETSTINRAVIVASVVAIVAALGTGLAVVTAGIGLAIPLAFLLAVVVVIYRHQLRPVRHPTSGVLVPPPACRRRAGCRRLARQHGLLVDARDHQHPVPHRRQQRLPARGPARPGRHGHGPRPTLAADPPPRASHLSGPTHPVVPRQMPSGRRSMADADALDRLARIRDVRGGVDQPQDTGTADGGG